MPQSAPRLAPGFLGPEFNRFLFAAIGTDQYGGQLSVVSALARLDLDAWAEAATLAQLPRHVAVRKLSDLLRKFTEIPQITQESSAIAARLIALLPGANTMRIPEEAPVRWAAASGATGLAVLVALGVIFGLQYATHTWSPHTPPPSTQSTSPPP